MENVPWSRSLSAKFGLFALGALSVCLLMVAVNLSVLDRLERHVAMIAGLGDGPEHDNPTDVRELRRHILLGVNESVDDIRRIKIVQGLSTGVTAVTLAGLLLLARRLSIRARALVARSELVASGDSSSLEVLDGNDEIAAASLSFQAAVNRMRVSFAAEREELETRLRAIASVNATLAIGTGDHAAGSSGEPPAVRGTLPPSGNEESAENVGSKSSTSQLLVRKRSTSVLLVDDDPAVLRGFGRVLKAPAYEVTKAQSARAAIDHLHQRGFDVIVSDIAMPGMDGLQFLREVRARDLSVPVVLVTGRPAVSTAAQAVELGAFQYLVKPVEQESLRQVVEHAARVHEINRARQEAAQLLGHEGALGADRAGLEAAFDRMLESLWIAYQPIVDVSARRVFAYEALLRSPEPQLPNPGAVLDAAERLGRLDLLGRTVRERAVVPMVGAPHDVKLFVNLHVKDLMDPALMDPGAPLSQIASRVVLEITERSSLEEVRDARNRVAALREMGFRIAVDDLGAGYAGLSSFALLEPEIVKIDLSLIRDVHKNATKQRVIRSLTSLCLDMGIQVIAEGIETPQERDALMDLGCTLLQGYLFAKPGKAFPEVSAWAPSALSEEACSESATHASVRPAAQADSDPSLVIRAHGRGRASRPP